MDEQGSGKKPEEEPAGWHTQAPRVSDAFRKGVSVTVTTWGGRSVEGLVCDRDPAGVLLETRVGSNPGYVFLPWSSVEQVAIDQLTPRRVKFLQS
ncbi:MAG TPA: hypothetical protein VFJ72_05060 [Rubrobacteraceae bacterium]|nr:hypothetical protein [Rubrobacteraceae bacterium]